MVMLLKGSGSYCSYSNCAVTTLTSSLSPAATHSNGKTKAVHLSMQVVRIKGELKFNTCIRLPFSNSCNSHSASKYTLLPINDIDAFLSTFERIVKMGAAGSLRA